MYRRAKSYEEKQGHRSYLASPSKAPHRRLFSRDNKSPKIKPKIIAISELDFFQHRSSKKKYTEVVFEVKSTELKSQTQELIKKQLGEIDISKLSLRNVIADKRKRIKALGAIVLKSSQETSNCSARKHQSTEETSQRRGTSNIGVAEIGREIDMEELHYKMVQQQQLCKKLNYE